MFRALAFLAIIAMAAVVGWLTWEAGTHTRSEDRPQLEEAEEFFRPILGR